MPVPGGDIFISGAQMLEDLALTRNGVATSTNSVNSSSSPGSLSYTHTDTTSESQVTSPSHSSVASRNGFPMPLRTNSQTNIWGPPEHLKEPEVFNKGNGNGNGNGHGFIFPPLNGHHHVNGRRYANGTQLPDVAEVPNANDAAFASNAYQLPANNASDATFASNAYQLPGNIATDMSPEHPQAARGIFARPLAPAVQPIRPNINNRFAQVNDAIQDLP